MRSVARRPAALSIAVLTAAVSLLTALAVLLRAAPASAAPSRMSPRVVVDHRAIDSLNGLSVAGDGSGGMVFLETVGHVPHVFVSRLEQGAWKAPERVDVGLSAASSQPQIAADDHGELIVAFVNAGALYVDTVRNPSQSFATATEMATGASNPSVSISPYGIGYLAYTVQDGAGYDVDVDNFNGKAWYPASPHDVNVTAADNAGTGAGAPEVVSAGDGVGIVTWGENGHIYSRRVWGTAPSVQTQQLDPASVAGWTEVTADSPRITVGGDSSFPVIVFREEVTSAGRVQYRVLAVRVVAETAWLPAPIDDLGAGSGNATQLQLSSDVSGAGFATVAGAANRLIATPFAADGYLETPAPLPPGGGAAVPYAAPSSAGRGSVIAWQLTPRRGPPRILVSWAPWSPKGGHPQAPVTVSAGTDGPTDAALGLFAGGDDSGDAVVAWVQGRTGRLSIDSAELVSGPGDAVPRRAVFYTNRSRPTLRWAAASESWGTVRYAISVDGSVLSKTTGLEWRLRSPLKDGRHLWWLTTTNEVSKSSTGTPATFFVDTHPPVVHAHLRGIRKAGRTLKLMLSYADLPNPKERGSRWSSGVASATVNWGEGGLGVSRTRGSRVARHVHDHLVDYTATVPHVYRSGGRYTVTVTVTDRAGNATIVTQKLVVQPVPNRKSVSQHKEAR